MVDLKKFTKEKIGIAPVVDGRFKYDRKEYDVGSNFDGWNRVSMIGNKASVLEPVYPHQLNEILDTEKCGRDFDTVIGYTYNNKIIFQNFDVAKRRWGKEISDDLQLNNADTFSPIRAVVWEDRRIYYWDILYSDFKTIEIKQMFNSEEDIRGTKGVTPEMRTCYLFHRIERDQLRALEEARRKKEEMKAFLATIQGRLQHTFEQSGAKMNSYSLTGNRAVVEWEIGGTRFNSVIDAQTFMVIEAGYCMTGDDRRHNITSLVKTADDWQEEGRIYRTRGEERDAHF